MNFSEESEKCRLCLKNLTENCEPITETVQHTLNFLTLCPNLTISDDPMMCETCAVNLKKCFDFKARCLSTEDCITSFTDGEDKKVDIRDIYLKVKLDENIEKVPDDHSVCHFCLEIVNNNDSVSVKDDVDLIEILQKYFLEMELRIKGDIIACTSCYKSLRFFISFVNNYLDIEEKIDEYCKVEGVNYKGQVDLKDVATFVSKCMLNVENTNSLIIKEDEVGIEIKFEELRDVKQENGEVPNKEVEQCNSYSCQDYHSPSQSDREPQLKREKQEQCTSDISGYQSNCGDGLQEHILTHKGGVLVETYICEFCFFQAKFKDSLREHMLTCKHRNTPVPVKQDTMYKNALCDCETTKSNLKKHIPIHRTPSEITAYKCALCDFETKYKCNLTAHVLTHKDPSEITMYKCDLCVFRTKRKRCLKRHFMLIHKTASEVTTYKCGLCDFETKYKCYLKSHVLTHKAASEISMHKCDLCDYKTKWKECLKKHMIIHKTPSEITWYKCNLCKYETKYNRNLKKHMLIHKTPSELTMYKCDVCDYEAKDRGSVKHHMLTHRTPSEIAMYKCDVCDYEAKWKHNLNKHMISHKTLLETANYKCGLCAFESKYKCNLQKHKLKHKDGSEIEIHKS